MFVYNIQVAESKISLLAHAQLTVTHSRAHTIPQINIIWVFPFLSNEFHVVDFMDVLNFRKVSARHMQWFAVFALRLHGYLFSTNQVQTHRRYVVCEYKLTASLHMCLRKVCMTILSHIHWLMMMIMMMMFGVWWATINCGGWRAFAYF